MAVHYALSGSGRQQLARPPAYSVIPVVGDGKWIWTKPPTGDTGYLEPRPFRASIGVRVESTGNVRNIIATTPVPVSCPEQKLESVDIKTQGCQATLQGLTDGAGQLVLAAAGARAGQVIGAVANFRLLISKQYHGYQREQFPLDQSPPKEVRREFLQDSPGVQTRDKSVVSLAAQLSRGATHPWDKAQRFAEWIPRNIQARIGSYTSVIAALKDRVGDCEERSSVFVALCRAQGIPARLVWVPNHNWSEFYLHDEQGQGHWIPVHTACYSWFGWVGAHELVLQKGDRIRVPERHRQFRLVEDWAQWSGAKPRVTWFAELTPEPPEEGGDPGPGARKKDAKGEWVLTGEHPADRYLRR